MNKPFIHIFRGPLGCYLYDVNTDNVVEITEETFDLLHNVDCLENMQLNEEIESLYKSGLLSDHRVEKSLHPETPYLETYYARNLNYLILQVTQSCNLDCSYCIYSDNYYTRSHSSLQMSFDTAKRAIDFVFDRSADARLFRVGFYGGEPLLRFDLITQCVKYIQEKMKGEKAAYNITTNGTLLSGEVVEFLIENSFEVTISLDGPKEIHDKDRKFRVSGKGSFDVVVRNLKRIQNAAPDYYRNNIRFNTVLTTEHGFSAVNEFFNSDVLVKDNDCSCGVVSDVYRNDELNIGRRFRQEYNFEIFRLLYSKTHREATFYSKYLEKNYGSQISERLRKRNRSGLGRMNHHGGPCIPGVKRIFVSVDGTIYPCEKVIENSEITKLGDIYNGIDINRAGTILNIEKMQKTNCRSCWAYRYCTMCIVGFSDICAKTNYYAEYRCKQIRKKFEEDLIDYITLIKLGTEFD